jgi:S-disulfanyl-L-cysteine oxidoreductase SoxD
MCHKFARNLMDRDKAMGKTLGIVVICAIILAQTAVAQENQKGVTVLDGVFTAAQAERGKEAYAVHCSSCHTADLSGLSAPALKGDQFIDNWREDKLTSLFTLIRTTMPARARGSLNDETYLDILSHILSVNTFPAGSKELTKDAIDRIQFVGKNGPAPIPKFVLITVAGCLARGEDNEWKLERASAPIRTRNEQPTDAELKASTIKPLGSGTFRLVYIDSLRPAFDPERHVGQKLHGHGYLLSNARGEGLSVTWLEAVASTCME